MHSLQLTLRIIVCPALLSLACAAGPDSKRSETPAVTVRAQPPPGQPPNAQPRLLAPDTAPALVAPAAGAVRPLAFPGALGWAATTPGGRGGRVIRVTTLAARGPGSFAQAIAAPGRRIVVFEVGGVIDLERTIVSIRNPYLTIAGQTAPSPGITLIEGGINIRTHDVIVQHLRVRPGTAGAERGRSWQPDAISTLGGASNVIVDHCSLTWSIDENLSASGPRFAGKTPEEWRRNTSHDITFSNNIIAEGLSHSVHPKGEHSKGSLIHDNVTNVVIARNLYFSNVARNPLLKGGAGAIVANNLISNPRRSAIQYGLVSGEWGRRPHQTGQLSVVGNVLQYGPSTRKNLALVSIAGAGRCELYLGENLLVQRRRRRIPLLGGNRRLWLRLASKPSFPHLPLLHARDVARYLSDNVGALPRDRDAIDARIVAQAITGGGRIIDHEDQVEGYPTPEPTRAPFVAQDWDLTTMTQRQVSP